MKFFADNAGTITGLKFYKAPLNTGTHVGHLWTINGLNLGTLTWTGETASGWQQQNFTNPLPVCGNIHYVASYFDAAGHFSLDRPYFTAQYDNAPLHGLADGADGGNGVYNNPTDAFPSSTFGSSNYWVDVIFNSNSSQMAAYALSPTSGTNGQAITISGCNFNGTETATIGGVAATVTPGSSTSLTVTAPSGPANGPQDIVITKGLSTSTLPQSFTYTTGGGAPTVTAVSPTSGPTSGGGMATITGTGFISLTSINFGMNAATNVVLVNSTTITATIPAGAAGAVSVSATNANGTGTLSNAYTYLAPTGSLLTGCVVNSNNTPSCSTPAGWTLVSAVSFEDGTLGGGNIGKSNVSPSVVTTRAHTGTHSYSGVINGDDQTLEWRGPDLIGFRDAYISFWEYDDATATFNAEMFLGGVDWGAPQFMEVDFQNFGRCGNSTIGNNTRDNAVLVFGGTVGPTGSGQDNTDASPCLPINLPSWGSWTQYELRIRINDPTPLGQTSNAEMETYQNGVLITSLTPGEGQCSGQPIICSNLSGNTDLGAVTHVGVVGGVATAIIAWHDAAMTVCSTSLSDVAATSRPSTFNSISPCPLQEPPNGFFDNTVPGGFHRYFDDIIVLKK